MSICDQVQSQLAETGANILNDEMDRHFQQCAECQRYWKIQSEIDQSLKSLPMIDPPQELIDDALKISSVPVEPEQKRNTKKRWLWGMSVAASILLPVSILFIFMFTQTDLTQPGKTMADANISGNRSIAQTPSESTSSFDSNAIEVAESEAPMDSPKKPNIEQGIAMFNKSFKDYSPTDDLDMLAPKTQEELIMGDRFLPPQNTGGFKKLPPRPSTTIDESTVREDQELDESKPLKADKSESANERTAELLADQRNQPVSGFGYRANQLRGKSKPAPKKVPERIALEPVPVTVPEPEPEPEGTEKTKKSKEKEEALKKQSDIKMEEKKVSEQEKIAVMRQEEEKRRMVMEQQKKELDKKIAIENERVRRELGREQQITMSKGKDQSSSGPKNNLATGSIDHDSDRGQAAKNFMAKYAFTKINKFEPKQGYWRNTYIEGISSMKLIKANLQSWLPIFNHRIPATHRVKQAFDQPNTQSLAVYTHSDATHVDGPTRLRIQVGIQSAQRQIGLRPPMHVGVVFDLRDGIQAHLAKVKAILEALIAQKQPGDQFSVTIAGPNGGLLIPSNAFRYGNIQVQLQEYISKQSKSGNALNLEQAFNLAKEHIYQDKNKDHAFGTHLLLWVTDGKTANDEKQLVHQVHQHALQSISTSAVLIGNQFDRRYINQMVSAGQGNRRMLDDSKQAMALINQELFASSRVIARALRVNIRLAPGVNLIGVLGSQRLSQTQKQRIKQAEKNIDQRLSRQMGIHTDRGKDDDGIQIIIPSFYANDSHIILLDVIANKPGKIADVSIRFKDLLHKKNGIDRNRLILSAEPKPKGKIQYWVLKNLLAYEFAQVLENTAEEIKKGNTAMAIQQLKTFRSVLRDFQLEISEWKNDSELMADQKVIDQYLNTFHQYANQIQNRQQGYVKPIFYTLLYSAFLKHNHPFE